MDEEYIEGGLMKPDWVKDPETGQLLPIEKDQSWRTALNAFFADECQHVSHEAMRVTIADGRTQVMRCCTKCGDRIGSPMSQKDREWVQSLPWLSADLIEGYSSRRSRERHAIMLDLARRQFRERGRFTTAYRDYLASPEWKARRAKVMRRCHGKCEGCGDQAAVEVHHLTYRHFMEEFLFELVGLCVQCHDRYHAIDEEDSEQAKAE